MKLKLKERLHLLCMLFIFVITLLFNGGYFEYTAALVNILLVAMEDNTLGEAGFNLREKKAVREIIATWFADIVVANAMRLDTSSDTAMESIWKAMKINDKERQSLADKVLKKMGVNLDKVKPGQNIQSCTASHTISVDHENGTKDRVFVTLEFSAYSFLNATPYGLNGEISYRVYDTKGNLKTNKIGKGSVTWANIRTFAKCVENIGKSSLEEVYKKTIGENLDKYTGILRRGINEETENLIVEALTSDTVNTALENSYGKLSKNVWRVYTDKLT